MKIAKKLLLGLLALIFCVVLLVGILVTVNAPGNIKAMNKAVEAFIETVDKKYTVTEVDCDEYSTLKVYGIMKFHVRQYDAEDIGNLSVMTVNMGLMQMATVVLTPVERDIPLISMDYMYTLGKRTCYLEFFDLVLDTGGSYAELLSDLEDIKGDYSDLEDVIPSAAWYDTLRTVSFHKSGTRADDEDFIQMLRDGVEAIMTYAAILPTLTGDKRIEKIELQKSYSDALINNGGISTDAFTNSLGVEDTRAFYDNVLFKAE